LRAPLAVSECQAVGLPSAKMAPVPLRFESLSPDHPIATAELRELYEGTDWSPPNRSAYLALDGPTEVAFLGFDLTPVFVLYLLDVLPEHQKRGVGTETLAFAKDLGRTRGERRLLVRPQSLSFPKRDVEPFYLKWGFQPTPDDAGLWECSLL
jgi:GNAT superfamily N-acetyltransferase